MKVKLVSPQEIDFALQSGKAVVLDIRPKEDYEKVRVRGKERH